jgi:hypothetical protein
VSEESRPSTEEERAQCRELGCTPDEYYTECPLHGTAVFNVPHPVGLDVKACKKLIGYLDYGGGPINCKLGPGHPGYCVGEDGLAKRRAREAVGRGKRNYSIHDEVHAKLKLALQLLGEVHDQVKQPMAVKVYEQLNRDQGFEVTISVVKGDPVVGRGGGPGDGIDHVIKSLGKSMRARSESYNRARSDLGVDEWLAQ